MSKTISILLAEPTKVQLGDREILVAEIDWGHLLDFATKLSLVMSAFMRVEADGSAKISIDLTKLGEIIANSGELANDLLTATTGLTPAEIEKLPARVTLLLIDQALAVNLTEEFLNAGKALAARLKELAPAAAAPKSASSSKV